MKKFAFFFLILFCCAGSARAQAQTEGQFIAKLLSCLQKEDITAYTNLFPPADSMAYWVMQHTARNTDTFLQMETLLHNPMMLMETDSLLKAKQKKEFSDFLKKGKYLDLHWDQIAFVRFELEKLNRQIGILNRKVAPDRFMGYVFIRDMFTRKSFAFTILDIKQVNGNWYGGELLEVFEAASKDQYNEAWAKEKRRRAKAGLEDDKPGEHITKEDEDNDKPYIKKEVMDRKYYRGKFDNEISVELYIRYIKGGCPEVICSWEALFKFGDEDDYVKMQVARTAEGKWTFNEELGGMELKLEGKVYKGSWVSGQDKTEYDAVFKEVNASTKKIAFFDELLDKGIYKQ